MATTTAALECLPTCSSDRALEPNSELWTRLKSFQFCNGLCSRVASENQWSLEYTTQVLEEYRKLIYLLAAVDENLVASREIEEAWRVHLLYSHSYIIDLGMGVLGTVLHHDCDDGSQSKCEMSERFKRTLAAYRRVFGEPPATIWTEPHWLGYSWSESLTAQLANAISATPTIQPSERIPVQHQSLWQAIKTFQFDGPNAEYPFTLRLAEESFGCDLECTLMAIEEYRKFLFLAVVANFSVVPSPAVDEVWHLHLCCTELYWGKMYEICGRKVHHAPSDGTDEDRELLSDGYQRTLEAYERFFGTPPELMWRSNSSS